MKKLKLLDFRFVLPIPVFPEAPQGMVSSLVRKTSIQTIIFNTIIMVFAGSSGFVKCALNTNVITYKSQQ